MSEKRYLLNPKQGYVVPFTAILKKNCPHFIACDASGKPTFSDDDDMPFLLNPVTEDIVTNEEKNKKPGMVGVVSIEHAEQILAELGKHALKAPLVAPTEPVLEVPGLDTEPHFVDEKTEEEVLAPPAADIEEEVETEVVNISSMTRKKMVKLAMDVYEQALDLDIEVAVMREQLSVIINQNPEKGLSIAA